MLEGKIIGIEGPDGSGKTSFIKSFAKFLEDRGVRCKVLHIIKEGPIKDLVLHDSSLSDIQVAALYRIMADQTAQDIGQAIADGYTVLLDRTQMSWFIYQGEYKGLSQSVYHIEAAFPKFPKEDVLIVINGNPETLRSRVLQRCSGDLDNMENALIGEQEVDAFAFLSEKYMEAVAKINENDFDSRQVITLDAADDTFINVEIAYQQIQSKYEQDFENFTRAIE